MCRRVLLYRDEAVIKRYLITQKARSGPEDTSKPFIDFLECSELGKFYEYGVTLFQAFHFGSFQLI